MVEQVSILRYEIGSPGAIVVRPERGRDIRIADENVRELPQRVLGHDYVGVDEKEYFSGGSLCPFVTRHRRTRLPLEPDNRNAEAPANFSRVIRGRVVDYDGLKRSVERASERPQTFLDIAAPVIHGDDYRDVGII